MPVKDDRSVGWTRRSVAVSLLLAMEGQRKAQGLRLVQLREARGWSQEALAHEAGVSVKTISRFENGRHDGRRTTIDKLADALDVDKRFLEGPRPTPLGLRDTDQEGLTEVLELLHALDARLDAIEAALTVPHHGSTPPGERAVQTAQKEASRVRELRQADRKAPADPQPGTPDR